MAGRHFIYTPLHGWVTEQMQKKGQIPYDLIDTDDETDDEEKLNLTNNQKA